MMADILIRGVRMPVACSDCPSRDVSVCVWTDDYNVESYKFSRPSFCPLHELPEHGDLIDRSKLSFVFRGTTPTGMDFVRRYVVDGMPVIIPASEEKGGV